MALIERIDTQVFERLNTLELQLLLFASPVLVDDTKYLIPTKEFSFWVAGICSIATQADVDLPEFLNEFRERLSDVLRGSRGFRDRDLGDPFAMIRGNENQFFALADILGRYEIRDLYVLL